MTADAVVDLPQLLAAGDLFGQVGAVVALGQRLHRIQCQRHEQQEEKHRATVKDVARGRFGKTGAHRVLLFLRHREPGVSGRTVRFYPSR
ncbi:hypothetical protein D3C85_1602620 [compost metagenome]